MSSTLSRAKAAMKDKKDKSKKNKKVLLGKKRTKSNAPAVGASDTVSNPYAELDLHGQLRYAVSKMEDKKIRLILIRMNRAGLDVETYSSTIAKDHFSRSYMEVVTSDVWFTSREVLAEDEEAYLEQNMTDLDRLLKYASEGDVDVVKGLLEKSPQLAKDYRIGDQTTALHAAAAAGHDAIVDMLLAKGADVDAKDEKYRTPLHLACTEGHSDTVTKLVEQNADVNTRDERRLTPLHLAALSSRVACVHAVCNNGALINAKDDRRETPLHYGVHDGDKEVVAALLLLGANVDAKDKAGLAAIHIAARRGRADLVEMLINHGANSNARADNGFCAIHFAAAAGRESSVQSLLNHSCRFYALDEEGRKAIDISVTDSIRQMLQDATDNYHGCMDDGRYIPNLFDEEMNDDDEGAVVNYKFGAPPSSFNAPMNSLRKSSNSAIDTSTTKSDKKRDRKDSKAKEKTPDKDKDRKKDSKDKDSKDKKKKGVFDSLMRKKSQKRRGSAMELSMDHAAAQREKEKEEFLLRLTQGAMRDSKDLKTGNRLNMSAAEGTRPASTSLSDSSDRTASMPAKSSSFDSRGEKKDMAHLGKALSDLKRYTDRTPESAKLDALGQSRVSVTPKKRSDTRRKSVASTSSAQSLKAIRDAHSGNSSKRQQLQRQPPMLVGLAGSSADAVRRTQAPNIPAPLSPTGVESDARRLARLETVKADLRESNNNIKSNPGRSQKVRLSDPQALEAAERHSSLQALAQRDVVKSHRSKFEAAQDGTNPAQPRRTKSASPGNLGAPSAHGSRSSSPAARSPLSPKK